jgi:hypothetical protein
MARRATKVDKKRPVAKMRRTELDVQAGFSTERLPPQIPKTFTHLARQRLPWAYWLRKLLWRCALRARPISDKPLVGAPDRQYRRLNAPGDMPSAGPMLFGDKTTTLGC